MKIYFAAALICTVSLLTTSCRRPLDDVSAPLNNLNLEVRLAPVMPALTAVDVGDGHGAWVLRPDGGGIRIDRLQRQPRSGGDESCSASSA